MTVYSIKPRFQALLRPAVIFAARRGVTANRVTILAAAGSVGVGIVLAWAAVHAVWSLFVLLPAWLLFRMALNAADGMLAREHGQASAIGAYLNELADVVSDAALYAPLALVPPFGAASVGLVILLATLTEFAGALGPSVGAPRQYQGPLGKSDRAVLFGAIGLWIAIAGPPAPLLAFLMPGAAALLAVTIVNRIRAGVAQASGGVTLALKAARADKVADTSAADPAHGASTPTPLSLRRCEDGWVDLSDGYRLFYRHWPSEERLGAIVLLHRGHEHSGRVAHLADELDCPGHDIFAWDARGHGRSPGARGYSPSFDRSVRDLDEFIAHLGTVHGWQPDAIAVVAQSVGAALAAAWVHDYAPRIRALVLASPAFSVRLYVPFARAGLALMRKLRGEFVVNSYVKPGLLTHDPERAESFRRDPLITRAISVNVLLGLYETSDRVVADARAITLPVQLLVSGDDWVVRQPIQHRFFEQLGSGVKERHVLPGFYHDTLGEKDRSRAVALVRHFLLERFAEKPGRVSAVDADLRGYTRDEAERLATPLHPWSPSGLRWRLVRAGLRLAAPLSDGIRLGHETGFDSGSTLDYVYRNQALGFGPVGRLIDRAYLDSPGWSGIRQRKAHVEELLGAGAARLSVAGLPVRLLDIAAGHGRYVLDAVAGWPSPPDSILLRDYSALNVEAGRRLIAERGLQAVARFEPGDAFDGEALASVAPSPTLVVVSGLYELFADNALIRRSLAGLARAMPQDACLVYTNQPWHPQLAFIARALTSHRGGEAWVMRRRTQAEMDDLVAEAGFRKLTQRIDGGGIFTVSLAVRERA
jgi:alpha-beta hydrolase superfamily lysophospholipase/phosphatidylglycerophosphate synthase